MLCRAMVVRNGEDRQATDRLKRFDVGGGELLRRKFVLFVCWIDERKSSLAQGNRCVCCVLCPYEAAGHTVIVGDALK